MATLHFLKGHRKGTEFPLPAEEITLGRGSRCGLEIADPKASEEHLLLRREDGGWWIYDLQSSNGTRVNGAAAEASPLRGGDQVKLGDTVFEFRDGDGAGTKQAAGWAGTAEGTEDKPSRERGDPPPAAPAAGHPETTRKAARDEEDIEVVNQLHAAYQTMKVQLAQVIVGQSDVVEQMLLAIFCRGHALLVGVPGLAKTLLVSTLSHVLDLTFKRVQFTPDLMPSDITGTDVLEEDHTTGKRVFRFVKGPLFANMVLADEINRTPPKTQAALLEAMQEHHVTVGAKTYHLPEPFFVLATQNPIEQEGTYPLPEAQLDRFLFNIVVDYPSAEEEKSIIRLVTGTYKADVQMALTAEEVLKLQQVVRRVPVADHVIDYASGLARATRPKAAEAPPFVREMVAWGAGPRAGIALVTAAKARAVLAGRFHTTTADVRQVALPVLRHRVITTFNAEAAGVSSEAVVKMLIEHLKPEDDLGI